MEHKQISSDRSGFALLLVLLLAVVVGALALAAVDMTGNATIIGVHAEKQAVMESVSLAGTELGRGLVNRRKAFYPDSGYVELPADSLVVSDALGRVIAGYTRRVYAGPTGIATGQFGIFGSIVSVTTDAAGNRSIFRREMVQESFAKFAYFTDKETTVSGSAIYFTTGDQLFGPVHSNDQIRINTGGSGPIFNGPVTTALNVVNPSSATFRQGKEEGVGEIALPDLADIAKLYTYAVTGTTAIVSSLSGGAGEARTRIEFVAIDIDGDGAVTGDNEGFLKVYKSNGTAAADLRWVVAGRPSPVTASPNCGHRHVIAGVQYFYTAAQHDSTGYRDAANNLLEDDAWEILQSQPGQQRARCYPGGSDSLTTNLSFRANDGRGTWQAWTGVWSSPMPAAILARADRNYLIPMGRLYNPNFKGVIHVAGDVAISGVLRGRVTLATTGDIAIIDDMRYATDPGSVSCADILGLFAGGNIVVSDNAINAPMNASSSGTSYRTFDTTPDEVIHGVLLTLGSFTVANYSAGADDYEPCGTTDVGRGCLYVTGGIIQDRRGPVGQLASGGITGYLKRYSYDQCAATSPPPYYPTTGYFSRGRVFEVNPVGFDVGQLFDRLAAGSF